MKKHYLVLDSFRGLCACIVAMVHFNANSIFNGPVFYDHAAIYVDFFFVLSGFVIFSNYEDKLRNGYSIGKFTLLRFGRLWPLHFAVLMAFVLTDLIQFFPPFNKIALYKPFSAPGEGLGAIIANFFLVHSLHVTDRLAFNGPSWSISVEFYTYILFALILSYTGKYYRFVIATLGIACAVALYFLCGELYAKLDFGFLRCVYGFGCGALTWDVYKKYYNRLEPLTASRPLRNIVETGLFILTVIYIAYFAHDAGSLFAPLILSVIVLVFAFESGVVSRILKHKIFLTLGTLSYSIYMIHIFISGKFFSLPARLLDTKFGWHITVDDGPVPVFGTNIAYGTLMELFYVVVVVGCSFISYKIIEEPCRNWTRKYVRRLDDPKPQSE